MDELIEQLARLKKGVVVLGSRPGMGLTSTSLVLANKLADKTETLFVSYQHPNEELLDLLSFNGQTHNHSLMLDDSIDYYKSLYVQLVNRLNVRSDISVIFIDDLDTFLGEAKIDGREKKDVVSTFAKLAIDYSVIVVLNTVVSRNVELRGGDKRPRIRDFNWSRNLVGLANQVFVLYRPGYYGITESEDGECTLARSEIYNLKGLIE